MPQLVILSLKRTLPSCFICGKFLMQDFVWRLMQTSKTWPYERVIPVLHTLSLLCGYSGKTHLWESSWESGVHRAYNCWPTNTLTCVIFHVRCHDPLQPLPDSVWAINLLILPKPYSAVALSTLRRIKMEMITPGVMHIEKSATHNEVLYEAVK